MDRTNQHNWEHYSFHMLPSIPNPNPNLVHTLQKLKVKLYSGLFLPLGNVQPMAQLLSALV